MKTQSSSDRAVGFILALASLILGWAGTYYSVGAPTLPLSTFPVIPVEYFQHVKPFKFSTIIVIWMVTGLFFLDGLSLLIRAKRSDFLRAVMLPVVGIAFWAVPAAAIAMEMDFGPNGVILCMLIGGALGARFTAKII